MEDYDHFQLGKKTKRTNANVTKSSKIKNPSLLSPTQQTLGNDTHIYIVLILKCLLINVSDDGGGSRGEIIIIIILISIPSGYPSSWGYTMIIWTIHLECHPLQ